MAETTRQVLRMCGIAPERLELKWASAAEGPRFVQLITDYVNRIKGLGELGQAQGEASKEEIKKKLDAAIKAAQNTKVRTAFGMLAKNLHKSGTYELDQIREGVAKKVVPAFEKQMAAS